MLDLNQAKKIIRNPKRAEVFIKELGGAIVLKGLTVERQAQLLEIQDNSSFRKRLLMETITEPCFDEKTIGFLFKQPFSIVEHIYELCMCINCMHPKTPILLRSALEDDSDLYNKFQLAKQTNIPIWSYGKGIDDWYCLEYNLWLTFQIVEEHRKNMGAIGSTNMKNARLTLNTMRK